jgi:hypothetical protein
MKVCPTCGQSTQDGARFCSSCGTPFAAGGSAESSLSPETASAGAPVAGPVDARPAVAPNRRKWLPLVYLLIVAVLGAGGFFAYAAIFQGAMSPADYSAKAVQCIGQIEAAFGTDASNAMSDITSTDPATRAAGKAAFDTAAKSARSAIASIRALRPPAEYKSIHDRLLAGLTVYETVIQATETYVAAAAAAGSDPTALSSAALAYSNVFSDPNLESTMAAYQAAYEQLKSGTGGTGVTP